MDLDDNLNKQLLGQPFNNIGNTATDEETYKLYARGFAIIENAIAVLSNLRDRKSHIFYGSIGNTLGIAESGSYHCIDSIWEKEILERIHPDDLADKQLQELKFLHYVKQTCTGVPSDYVMESVMRMSDSSGKYYPMRHRIYYFPFSDRNVWLALCLYTFGTTFSGAPQIFNTATGETIRLTDGTPTDIISSREKDVLRLIEKGMLSKEIAEQLSISPYTVNRHRQNILEKLQAGNSIEACRIAKELKII